MDFLEAAAELAVLTENLDRPNRRAVIDPLIAKLRKALRIRWNTQLRHLEDKGLPHLEEALGRLTMPLPHGVRAPGSQKRRALMSIPYHQSGFAQKFRKVTATAYATGVERVTKQLPTSVAEAPRKPVTPALAGPSRDPEDVEDELDETTTERVSGIIDRAFSTPLTYAAMVGLVREEFRGWGDAQADETSRAETVALQEVSTAYHDGGADYVDTWRGGNGPVEKRWSAEDDACEICLENEAEDFIDSEAPHSSGDDEPPAHPNCRCEEEYQPTPE